MRPGRRGLALASLPLAGLVFLASVFVRPTPGHSVVWDDWYNNAVSWAAAAVCLLGAWRSARPRSGALLLAAALCLYSAGNTVWTVAILPMADPPYPSVADYLWLAFYPLAVAAIALMARGQVGGTLLHWVDGLIAALGVGAVGILVSVGPISHNVTGDVMAILVNMGYPVGDLILIMLLVTLAAASQRKPSRAWLLLGGALLIWTVADTSYVFQVAAGSYTPGTVVDAGWLIPTTLIALVPWLEDGRPAPAPAAGRPGVAMLLPVAMSGVCLVLLAWQSLDEARWFALVAVAALTAAGARLILTVREVEQLTGVRAEARTDALTGLGNRRQLTEVLDTALLDTSTNQDRGLTLMLMDLDGFKDINDTLGHEAGDQVLAVIGTRLRECVRDGDALFRLGGDEFAVVVSTPGALDVDRLITRLTAAIATPIGVGDVQVRVGVSIGVVTCPDQARQTGEALRLADIAMYHAKRGRLGSAHYEPGLDTANQRRLTMAVQLRQSLQNGAFDVEYQPVVDVASGRALRVEALLRWNYPDLGRLMPGSFLDVVTDAGQHEALTRFVLHTALTQHLAWAAAGVTLPVSVNVGGTDLNLARIVDLVDEALGHHPVAAGQLMIEITEQCLERDPDHGLAQLVRLSERGVPIVLDDFGAGFTSLAYLRDLPLDEVKIDRAFVASCATDPVARSIVEQTFRLADRLGLRAVAEGVEDTTVRQNLLAMGCVGAQGYLWAPALPPDNILDWIAAAHDRSDPLVTS